MSATMDADDPGLDLSQFHQVFFEEAADNLESFEQLLLALDPGAPADETMHAVFRCAHSVKGGAATFGFGDVADLTHAMETLLDRLRRHELSVTTQMVDTLLAAGDTLRELLNCRRDGGKAPDTSALLAALKKHCDEDAAVPAGESAASVASAKSAAAPAAAGMRDLELIAGPLVHPSIADDIVELFAEVTGGGKLEKTDPAPGQAEGCVRFHLMTTASDADVIDLCSFHIGRDAIKIAPWPKNAAPSQGYEIFDTAAPAAVTAEVAAPPKTARKAAVSETLRVAVEKVDQLINLMGELVITQAMLAQRAEMLNPAAREQLIGGLTDLERTTRDLQESVMSIRMIPMSDVFNRFPRMLRDLAARMGKQIELRTEGEATELDKGLIEKITDPLTHLVRNSVDHGIEMPADRIAAGKPAHGTLTLSARHEGGCILIEVRDDGKGLDREKILAKARASGLSAPDTMTDAEVWQLIFAPGLSTADAVTDISGRGVGMDVVKRNILSLGGSVELDSAKGRGTGVRVRLPLTLAIMDGMSVGVGDELYLLPLASIVESFQPQGDAVRTIGGGNRVVRVREEFLPVVSLRDAMGTPANDSNGKEMLVVVQAENRSIALEVDRLVGQQQVVVKNLEANYRKVPAVSGATIMGDGRVALILDVVALADRAASRREAAAAA